MFGGTRSDSGWSVKTEQGFLLVNMYKSLAAVTRARRQPAKRYLCSDSDLFVVNMPVGAFKKRIPERSEHLFSARNPLCREQHSSSRRGQALLQ